MINFRVSSVVFLLCCIALLGLSSIAYESYGYAERSEHSVRTYGHPAHQAHPVRNISIPAPLKVAVISGVRPAPNKRIITLEQGGMAKNTSPEEQKPIVAVKKEEPKVTVSVPTETSPKSSSKTSTLTSSQKNELLSIHNKARDAVGLDDLKWSNTLANGAQMWAEVLKGEKCEMRHSSEKLGENLFIMWSSDKNFKSKASDAVNWWVNEKKFYNYDKNTCKVGEQCGHYAQIVWEDTTEVGCAMTTCATAKQVKDLWVCRYSPRGNLSGEKPY